jgi:hypothetical protein
LAVDQLFMNSLSRASQVFEALTIVEIDIDVYYRS